VFSGFSLAFMGEKYNLNHPVSRVNPIKYDFAQSEFINIVQSRF